MNKFWIFLAVFISVFTFNAFSQNSKVEKAENDSVASPMWNFRMGEIVVTSMRFDRKIRELPTPMTVVGSNEYQKQSAFTLSNVLSAEPGIAMGSDGVWSTSINIRGMGESRLVTLIDGNRVETATDLTVSFSMIDVNDIERVEVIKGAQSSVYGTGAMGGIVNIITKEGRFADKPFISGNFISGFASVNQLSSNHLSVNAGSEKWYLRVSGAYSHASDLRTPEGILPNSQFTTRNISAKIGLKPFIGHLLKLQYQNNIGNDIGIPGGEAFPKLAEASYTDIGRRLLNGSYEITDLSEKLTSLKINYFNQIIIRDVSVKPNSPAVTKLPNGNTQRTTPDLMTPKGNHFTNGAQLQGTWNLSGKNTFVAGADIWGRKLTTSREKYITVEVFNPQGTVLTTKKMVRGETPIPKSWFNSAGLFFQDEIHLMDNRLTLITGGRIDEVWIKNEDGFDVDYLIVNGVRNNAPVPRRLTFSEGVENSFSWSASGGLLYKLKKNTDVSLNLARSFRAPSLEERFKYIDLGNYVRLGNPSLKPEKGYSADLGLRVWKPKFFFQSNLFVNRINQMIVESPGEFIYTLTSETKPDTLPAFVNSNVSKALLYGFDFKLDYNFSHNWVLFFSGTSIRGKNTEAHENLPLIPPLNGRLGVRYSYAKAGSAELTLTGAAKQDKIAEGETKTNGYVRLDMAFNTKKINLGFGSLQFFAGIDNLTNTSYTNHLSTNRGDISTEPGRNIFMRMNLSF